MQCRLKLDISWKDLVWAAFAPPASQDSAEIIRRRFQAVFPDTFIVFGLSARTLFDAILSEGVSQTDDVLMSGVNIETMFEILQSHGLRPCTLPVRTDTLLPEEERMLAAQTRTGAKLAVIAHLFGARSPVHAITALQERGVLIIEDMAQGFSLSSQAPSLQADVTLFSFGPIKRRTALGGGVAVFRDAHLASRVAARLAAYPARSDTWFRLRALKYMMLKALSYRVPYGLLFRALTALGYDADRVIGEVARGFKTTHLLTGLRHRPPSRLLSLLARQIPERSEFAHRLAVCAAFHSALPSTTRLGAQADFHSHWLMPVRTRDPGGLILALREAGFDATCGATSLRDHTPPTSDTWGLHLNEIVYLPHPADMDTHQRQKMLTVIQTRLAGG